MDIFWERVGRREGRPLSYACPSEWQVSYLMKIVLWPVRVGKDGGDVFILTSDVRSFEVHGCYGPGSMAGVDGLLRISLDSLSTR